MLSVVQNKTEKTTAANYFMLSFARLTRITISLAMPIGVGAHVVTDGVVKGNHRQRFKGHGRSAPGNRLVAYPLVADKGPHAICISVAI